ncbi:hypothetical protein QTP88_015467 [Uroleucon formosanum]
MAAGHRGGPGPSLICPVHAGSRSDTRTNSQAAVPAVALSAAVGGGGDGGDFDVDGDGGECCGPVRCIAATTVTVAVAAVTVAVATYAAVDVGEAPVAVMTNAASTIGQMTTRRMRPPPVLAARIVPPEPAPPLYHNRSGRFAAESTFFLLVPETNDKTFQLRYYDIIIVTIFAHINAREEGSNKIRCNITKGDC